MRESQPCKSRQLVLLQLRFFSSAKRALILFDGVMSNIRFSVIAVVVKEFAKKQF